MHQAVIAATLAEVMEEGAAAATATATATGAVNVKSHSACQDHCHPRGKGALLPLTVSLLIENTYKDKVLKFHLGSKMCTQLNFSEHLTLTCLAGDICDN